MRGTPFDLWDGTTRVGCPLPFQVEFAPSEERVFFVQGLAMERRAGPWGKVSSQPRTLGGGGGSAHDQESADAENALFEEAIADGDNRDDWQDLADFFQSMDLLPPSPPDYTPCTQAWPAGEWNSCFTGNQTEKMAECGDPPCAVCVVGADVEADVDLSLDLTVVGNFFNSHVFSEIPQVVALINDWTGGLGTAAAWELDIIDTAWAFLVENVDIVRWAACLVGGQDLADCLSDKILASGVPGGKVDIVLTDDTVCSLFGATTFCSFWDPLTLDETIHIGRSASDGVWDLYHQAYLENPRCAAISLAGTLLHELWHLCNPFHWGDVGSDCDEPFMLENNFRWAMYNDCTKAASSPCCALEFDKIEGNSHLFYSASLFPCE